jgi:hypothetical protein
MIIGSSYLRSIDSIRVNPFKDFIDVVTNFRVRSIIRIPRRTSRYAYAHLWAPVVMQVKYISSAEAEVPPDASLHGTSFDFILPC